MDDPDLFEEHPVDRPFEQVFVQNAGLHEVVHF